MPAAISRRGLDPAYAPATLYLSDRMLQQGRPLARVDVEMECQCEYPLAVRHGQDVFLLQQPEAYTMWDHRNLPLVYLKVPVQDIMKPHSELRSS